MPARAQLESQAPPGRRRLSSPTKALRMSGAKSTLPGLTATPLLHMRPPPCRHCAASARRRSCDDSRLPVLAKFLEARVAPERVEVRIEAEQSRRQRYAIQTVVRNLRQVL